MKSLLLSWDLAWAILLQSQKKENIRSVTTRVNKDNTFWLNSSY